MLDALEHVRQHDRAAEDLAFVHKVCQPLRVRFSPELHPGAVPFHVEDVVDAFAQVAEQTATHAVLEHDESLLVELMPFFIRHGSRSRRYGWSFRFLSKRQIATRTPTFTTSPAGWKAICA